MKDVLFVIGSMRQGGAETQLYELLLGLTEQSKFDINPVLFVFECQGQLREKFESLGIKIISGDFDSNAGKVWRRLSLVRVLLRLVLATLSFRYRFIISYLPLANIFSAIAVSMTFGKVKLITNRRALNTHQDTSAYWKTFDWLSSTLSLYVVSNSRAVANDTIARDPRVVSKSKVIHNAVPLQPLSEGDGCRIRAQYRRDIGLHRSCFSIIVVANLIEYKGHVDLINAVAMLRKHVVDWRLLLVGEDRGCQSKLEQMVDQLDLRHQVIFLGHRDDISQLLVASDLYISSSHEEGFSNSLLEALVTGLPCVATSVGGNVEMLQGVENTILVPSKDPANLYGAILKVVSKHVPQKPPRPRDLLKRKYSRESLAISYNELLKEYS